MEITVACSAAFTGLSQLWARDKKSLETHASHKERQPVMKVRHKRGDFHIPLYQEFERISIKISKVAAYCDNLNDSEVSQFSFKK